MWGQRSGKGGIGKGVGRRPTRELPQGGGLLMSPSQTAGPPPHLSVHPPVCVRAADSASSLSHSLIESGKISMINKTCIRHLVLFLEIRPSVRRRLQVCGFEPKVSGELNEWNAAAAAGTLFTMRWTPQPTLLRSAGATSSGTYTLMDMKSLEKYGMYTAKQNKWLSN